MGSITMSSSTSLPQSRRTSTALSRKARPAFRLVRIEVRDPRT
jgi:hypothetical protein